jgi:putative hydrolase of the HAD superfamily
MIQHVFFDLDRTLWDFDSNSDLALRELFFEFELDKQIDNPDTFIHKYKEINDDYWNNYRVGKTTKEALRSGRFFDTLQQFEIADKIIAEKLGDRYLELCPTLTKLFPGTIEMLSSLQNLGINLHIITNGFAESQHIKLTNCGLSDYFQVIICSDELSVNKPDPAIFLEAMKRADATPKNSVMIGDHPEIDVLGATAVGMRGVLFNPQKNYSVSPAFEQINHWDEFLMLLLKMN